MASAFAPDFLGADRAGDSQIIVHAESILLSLGSLPMPQPDTSVATFS